MLIKTQLFIWFVDMPYRHKTLHAIHGYNYYVVSLETTPLASPAVFVSLFFVIVCKKDLGNKQHLKQTMTTKKMTRVRLSLHVVSVKCPLELLLIEETVKE